MPNATRVQPDGARLRELRQARSLSQKALADELGRDQPWVSAVEKGRPVVSRAAVKHLALYFGVSVQDITVKPAETPLADAA